MYKDLTSEQKQKRIAATRRWQAKNRDKVKISHRRANKVWRQRNPDKVRAIGRAAYAANPDKYQKKRRASYSRHAAKRIASARQWAKDNPERFRRNARRAIWRKAGIDVAIAEATLAAHSGKCDCCGRTSPGGKHGRWNLDHDHNTGRVRGVLCLWCNVAIGKLGDTLEGVMQAVKYLSK